MRVAMWRMGLVVALGALAACATGINEAEDDEDGGSPTSSATGTTSAQAGPTSGPGPGAGGAGQTASSSSVGGSAPASSSSGSGGGLSQWSCDPTYYGDSICDCGCGVVDVDCADATVASCDYCDDPGSCASETCPANIDPTNNAVCVQATCGNSVVEPGEQCDDGNTVSGDGCSATCQAEVPTQWTCSPTYYAANDGCDCGCGVVDPDCASSSNTECDYCDDTGSCQVTVSGCPGLIDPSNNAVCIQTQCGNSVLEPGEQCDDGNTVNGDGCDSVCQLELPSQWTCNPAYYGTNDGCDCGCGVIDPDCPNANVSSCDYCDDAGSCGTGLCPANIHPTNNAVCI